MQTTGGGVMFKKSVIIIMSVLLSACAHPKHAYKHESQYPHDEYICERDNYEMNKNAGPVEQDYNNMRCMESKGWSYL